MFFQSPRPFGQHSTSYRSMSGNIYSSSSMTSLQMPESKSGRASAPPISFTSVYEGSRFGLSGPSVDHTSVSSTNFKNVEEDRPNIVSSAGTSALSFKNEKHRNAVLHDSSDSGGTSGRNLNIFQPEVRIPISKSNVFQVQRRNINQQPPPWVRQTQSREPQSEQILQNVRKEYHPPIANNQVSRFPSDSTLSFAEHAAKPIAMQSQPVPVFSTGGYASMHEPTHEHGGFPEARVSSSAQFSASQVPFNEQQQRQKAIAYQQLERNKNYATLQRLTSKVGPLQRRTSDPTLIKTNGNDLPENIAMFNVAKGVRAELEQDPKFRRKADILSKRTAAESVTDALSPPPLKEQSKQSPSLRQMGNFFEQNVQQFHNVLSTKRPPPVPSAKPFNLEHVRSIFRASNTARTESPPAATSTSIDTQPKQNSVLLGKPIKTLVEMREAQEGMSDTKLKENTQTSGIIKRHIISQNTELAGSAGKLVGNKNSARKLVEQKVCSASDISKTNMQTNSTTFIADKPVITTGDKGPEMRKETLSHEQPIISQDIAILEKNYDSLTTFAAPRRLNQPFPVDDVALVSCSRKTRSPAGPPGILMKDGNSIRSVNDSGIKTPKKVAFQCDRDNIGFTKDEVKGCKTSAETPPSVVQYDDAVNESLQRLLKLSADIGGDLQTVGNKLSALFTEQRNFIWLAAGQKEPSIDELQAKLSPLIKLMEDLSKFKESKRNTPFFNHISAASEGIQALGWVTVKHTPAPFIKDMFDASMFFVNRVLKERKDDKNHTEWAKSWSDVLNALQKYVRQVHTTGLVWNSCPLLFIEAISLDTEIVFFFLDLFAAVSSETNVSTDKSDRAALFAEINAGEEITKRLKKVTPDMQTHKNPALRSQVRIFFGNCLFCEMKVEPGTRNKEPTLAVSDSISPVKKQGNKPPKTWLDNGKQWNVIMFEEYYKNNNSVMVEVSDMKQTVYIFKCENSVIQVGLTLGAMPTLSIQKTDGCQVYLSKSAMNAEIITSKSSEMNVLVPGTEDGDFVSFELLLGIHGDIKSKINGVQ
uniref:Adenylyl cyclase-associated protein n=1 Tax=Elaeophora elaphi TaxID=1147741 RepID=A0A0R3RT86_9BILA